MTSFVICSMLRDTMAKNYGLGRGLSSLIPPKKQTDDKIVEPKEGFNYFGSPANDNSPGADFAAGQITDDKGLENNTKLGNGPSEIDIALISPNPHQPRFHFDELKLQELANSIVEHGILQPIVVSKADDKYEIIAGERRFQAAKLAGLKKIPVIVRGVTEQQKLELAIIENIQRQDLNPIEEAKSYLKLMEEFDMNQDEAGKKLGKSRPVVANKIRLLNLPVEIQKGLMDNVITEGHAKAILALENPEKQRAMYEMILKNNLTVRQVENKAKEISVKPHKRNVVVDPQTKEIEESLMGILGTKVKLAKSGAGGKIMIEYYSQEELENILNSIIKK